ncbi:hypothetical protein L195_g033853 [Trifolium pratense]|uniref:Uncharacterized protein n=1 Tax=Trifolium pratense TaxID=57577 RepID=A0A2K3LH64_TRIPR|nr:hypothetical protein L195_g033853 [Trifolium pratense]
MKSKHTIGSIQGFLDNHEISLCAGLLFIANRNARHFYDYTIQNVDPAPILVILSTIPLAQGWVNRKLVRFSELTCDIDNN